MRDADDHHPDRPDASTAAPSDVGRGVRRAEGAGSCRECPVWCERVVYPSGCFEAECPRLYTYEEDGRTFFGCMEGVYEVDVDLERFREAQRTRAGFGALKVSGHPRPMCRCDVDPSHPARASGPCVEPDFLMTSLRHPYEVTDLRGISEPGPRGGGR